MSETWLLFCFNRYCYLTFFSAFGVSHDDHIKTVSLCFIIPLKVSLLFSTSYVNMMEQILLKVNTRKKLCGDFLVIIIILPKE